MKSNIQHKYTNIQGSAWMHDVYTPPLGFGFAARSYVHNILREYGEVHECSFYAEVKDLDLVDQKILLSYIAEDWEYKDALTNSYRLYAWIKEYYKDMQKLLNSEGEEAYRDYMEEAHCYRDVD